MLIQATASTDLATSYTPWLLDPSLIGATAGRTRLEIQSPPLTSGKVIGE
jgi:hypothetical protein